MLRKSSALLVRYVLWTFHWIASSRLGGVSVTLITLTRMEQRMPSSIWLEGKSMAKKLQPLLFLCRKIAPQCAVHRQSCETTDRYRVGVDHLDGISADLRLDAAHDADDLAVRSDDAVTVTALIALVKTLRQMQFIHWNHCVSTFWFVSVLRLLMWENN